MLRDVTDALTETYDLPTPQPVLPAGDPNDYPLVTSVCSPAPDTIRFIGQRFLTANLGAVGYVIPRMAEYGSVLGGAAMIVELADLDNGWVLNTHTDTIIELSNPAFTTDDPIPGGGSFWVNGVAFHNADTLGYYYYEPWGQGNFGAFVDGSGCPAVPDVTSATSPAGATLKLEGTDLDIPDGRWRVFASSPAYDRTYYRSDGPNAGLNDPGVIVNVTDNKVIIFDPQLADQNLDYFQTRDGSGAVVDEFYNDVTPGEAPPVGVSYDANSQSLLVYNTGVSFSDAYAAIIHGKYPMEVYAPDMEVITDDLLKIQWYTGGGVNSDHNRWVTGVEVFPFDEVEEWVDFANRIVLYVLTDNEIDLTEGGYAQIRKVSSPADNQLQIEGTNFLSDAQGSGWNFDYFQITNAGPASLQVYSNPSGPHAGDLSPGATIIEWTDTSVIVEDPALDGLVIGIEDFEAYQGAYSGLSLRRANNNTLVNAATFPDTTVQ
jgi:hypothetical protein